MDKRLLLLTLSVFSFLPAQSQETNFQKAMRIAQENILVDGHVDIPYRLSAHMEDISTFTKLGDFDYQRSMLGGLNAPFMSIYVGASHQQVGEGSGSRTADAYEKAKELIELVNKLVKDHPKQFALAKSLDDLHRNFKNGLISLPMGMENGAPIEGDLDKLREFHKLGIRYITLTHSKWNHIGDSSYDEEKKWGGLSPFGKVAVLEMNKLGIMVDISHVSDQTFYQVVEISKVPVIASHSSVRHFTPNFERNMDDNMLKALAKNGGVIMINFGSSFLTKAANGHSKFRIAKRNEIMKERGLDLKDKDAAAKVLNEVRAMYPYPFANLKDVADHIDHVKNLIGIDYVGLGSDFDGVDDSLPIGLKNASMYPFLLEELLNRGYTEEELIKLCSGNILRVWKRVEDYSKRF
jgi:membrane dipeptidase